MNACIMPLYYLVFILIPCILYQFIIQNQWVLNNEHYYAHGNSFYENTREVDYLISNCVLSYKTTFCFRKENSKVVKFIKVEK